jgi:hypothetical protein
MSAHTGEQLQNGTGGPERQLAQSKNEVATRGYLPLLNALEVEAGIDTNPNVAPADLKAYKAILNWTRTFLCKPIQSLDARARFVLSHSRP